MKQDPYKITFKTWNKVAGMYRDKFMDLDLYNDTYDRFCDEIKITGPKVLEIGCGPGNITKYILARRPDIQLEGIDVAPDMIKLAQENNPDAVFHVMDCRDLDLLTGKYDAILCGFCMPYLSKQDCGKLVRDSAVLMNSGSILYFSVIEGDYDQSGFETGSSGDKCFVYYHSEEYLVQQLKENEFELVCLERKEYPKTNEIISTHLIFIARKI